MTRVPRTSAVPNPASIFMPPTSSRDAAPSLSTMSGPEPTPLPVGPNRPDEPSQQKQQEEGQDGDSSPQELLFDYPKLRLNILALNHSGAARFLGAVNAATVLRESVQTVLKLLYTSPASEEGLVPPGTRSVTLYLEDMGGVAYTKGSDLDDDHKEIRMSFHFNK